MPTPSRRILLVDDELINRRVATRILAKLGHQADAADGAEEAIELIRRNSYDLVFTDIQMPGISGMEAVKLYREADRVEGRYRPAPLPVIALSADDSERNRQEYLAVGLNDMVGKPINPSVIAAMIDKWCPSPSSLLGPACVPPLAVS